MEISKEVLTHHVASKEDYHKHLAVIALTSDGAVSTDGHRMLVMPIVDNQMLADEAPILLPVASAAVVAKAMKRGECATLDLAATRENGHVALCAGSASFTPAKSEGGEFPNYRLVLPKSDPKVTLGINAEYVVDICKALLSLKGPKESAAIRVQVWDDVSPVRFSITTKDTETEAFAIVMPVRL